MSNVYTWSHLQDCLGTFLRPAYQDTPSSSDHIPIPPESDQGDHVNLPKHEGQPYQLSQEIH